MGESRLGPEHILLGLMREPDGVAGQALRNLGLETQQIVGEVFRTLLEQMKIVERAIRNVPAGVAWKRKRREELLAHLIEIYDEELERSHDPVVAMKQAARRFGDPAELTAEFSASLTAAERRAFYIERWFGWQAPESVARLLASPIDPVIQLRRIDCRVACCCGRIYIRMAHLQLAGGPHNRCFLIACSGRTIPFRSSLLQMSRCFVWSNLGS